MPTITEGQLRFDFPENWEASKFDEWSFYRNQFMKLAAAEIPCSQCEGQLVCAICGAKRVAGTKGIDILAIEVGSTCWQIEIKDYRQTRAGNFLFLADEVAIKVRDTLAALVAANLNANDAGEQASAKMALASPRIRIVLHLEQPTPHSIQQSKQTRKAHVLQRLKQLVKAIDPHPVVIDLDEMLGVAWNVTQIGVLPQ